MTDENKILPSNWYRDPSNVADSKVWELREHAEIRAKYGCKKCKHSAEAWNTYYCTIGKIPTPKYCRRWRLKDE